MQHRGEVHRMGGCHGRGVAWPRQRTKLGLWGVYVVGEFVHPWWAGSPGRWAHVWRCLVPEWRVRGGVGEAARCGVGAAWLG